MFSHHPSSLTNEQGEVCVPGEYILEILHTFSHNHHFDLLDPNEEEQLKTLVDSNPDIQVSPSILVQLIAHRTASVLPSTPTRDSPDRSPFLDSDFESSDEEGGRLSDFGSDYGPERSHSRASSNGSQGTSVQYSGSRPPSRPPSRGPPVPPKTPIGDSPFDTSRRRRGAPVENAPSSWYRTRPPTRRKSDASRNLSDSEVCPLLIMGA